MTKLDLIVLGDHSHCQLLIRLKLSDKAQAKLRKFFAKFDKDNDGTIDTQELKQILEMNGQEITDEDIDHFVSASI